MPPTSWLLVTLFTLVAGLACLVAAATLCMVASRQQKLARREIDQRLQILTQRLLMVESRITELGSREQSGRGLLSQAGAATPGNSHEVRRGRSLSDAAGNQNMGTEPPLIAVPDLGADAEPDGQSESVLAERHGEAWTLAAAGVPAAEIARQTGQPIGQAELIVALYRKLHSPRGSLDHARSR